jgi:hypothetical protein
MALENFDAIDRGVRILRAVPEPGWAAIESAVIAATRATPRGGWPIDVDDPEPGVEGTLRVTDLVLGTAVSKALAHDEDYAVIDIATEIDGTSLRGLTVRLSGRYLAELPAALDRVTTRCRKVVSEIIGARPDLRIDVIVEDVHR